jgi:hypothetical protein
MMKIYEIIQKAEQEKSAASNPVPEAETTADAGATEESVADSAPEENKSV